MFAKLRRAKADLATMNALLPAAERIARDDGIDHPGAEHLLLAALDLDDGIARTALSATGIETNAIRTAIAAQHEEALSAAGVVADDNAIAAALPPADQPTGPYRSQGSLQAAFQRAVELAKRDKAAVTSGHVLLGITEPEHGTAVRALQRLGVDTTQLRQRTRQLLESAHPEDV